MKTASSKKSLLFVIAVIVLAAAIAARRTHIQRMTEAPPLAVGLRGENRVSKPMSERQRERFEQHFLEMPAVPRPASRSGVPPSVAQAQAINAFNQKQNR